MRKNSLIRLILFVIALLCVCSACESKEPESLRICVDLEFANGQSDSHLDEILRTEFLVTDFLYAGKQKGIEVPRDFEIEYIPANGIERDTVLDRIRTEVMAGKGPDIFLCACTPKDSYVEGLFAMPEKAMELSVFLSLDEYMEQETCFADWDAMNETVLAAGRTDEGQQIIPLSYTIPAAIYRGEEAEHTPSKDMTWMDMLNSEDVALAATAVWTDNAYNLVEGMPFARSRASMTEFILGGIADYSEEELLFTEEELKQRMQEICTLADQYTAGEFEDAPVHYVEFLGQFFDRSEGFYSVDVRNGIDRFDPYEIIPLYSDDGGVTAEITVYGAINRNTKRPADAFRVLDYLASYDAQRSESIYYEYIYVCGNRSGIPMYDTLMSEAERVFETNSFADFSETDWCLLGENYEEFCSVREQITNVHFRGALQIVLDQVYWNYAYVASDEEAKEKAISEGYRRIQQMVRE